MPTQIEVVPRRMSKAQRAYETLRAAAWKLRILGETDLFQVAAAINPDFAKHDCQVHIFDATTWRDDSLSPDMTTLASGGYYNLDRMRETLVFFREQAADRSRGQASHDVRLVFAFHRSKEDSRSIWLDCETGLPWVPMACRRLRVGFSETERVALDARDAETYRKAAAAVRELKRQEAA